MPGVVIVGAGEAGVRVAQCLRLEGYEGEVTLLGEEPYLPYPRPPLSKRVLTAGQELRSIASSDDLAASRVTCRINTQVQAIEPDRRLVRLANGEELSYAALVLATGARARRLPTIGADEVGVAYLRSWDDAMRLKALLHPGVRVVVVGAGFIGLELAAAARMLGARVTVIEYLPRVLGRAVPAVLASLVADRHREEGVELLLGRSISSFRRAEDGTISIEVSGDAEQSGSVDETISADLVIAGIGAQPEVSLAEAAGLLIDNGVAVDSSLRSSDPHIYAVGDCCSFPHGLYGGRRVRLEAWRNAFDQAGHVAGVIAGTTIEPFSAVPWFWSDQYNGVLQVSGLADEAVTTVERPFTGARLLFHLAADGRLVSASSWGTNKSVAKDARVAEMLIAARAHPDPVALADPDLKMKSLL
jgi:3-phenylpropionate/trans-cinnamate dioxygenase ferredoxin reductase component